MLFGVILYILGDILGVIFLGDVFLRDTVPAQRYSLGNISRFYFRSFFRYTFRRNILDLSRSWNYIYHSSSGILKISLGGFSWIFFLSTKGLENTVYYAVMPRNSTLKQRSCESAVFQWNSPKTCAHMLSQ